MAGAIVGGAFLSAALKVLFDRIASRPVMDFIRGRKLSDALLKKLKITFFTVNALLNDVEEKQSSNPAVKAWLDELKDATYDAEDLLDEIVTEALRCKLEAESHSSTDQVQNFISTSLNPFNEGIKSKIEEILDRLQFIAKQKDVLGLKEDVHKEPSQKLPTTSLVDEFGVYGRDDDREQIIGSLLSDDVSDDEICVIPIVGMGGLGKTTLAQLVYNDHRVKVFELKAWVCVSEEFDVFRITKIILEAITQSACDFNDLNMLQVKLKECLSRKKFLLILDDVWNENYNAWDVLRGPFRSAAKGSKIIVTTRNEGVASIMRTAPTHHLKQLLDKDCWLLFAKHAFYNGNYSAHQDLEVIGREIVTKCKGLPLAAKTLGGLLRFKLDAEEWSKILKSNLWDFPKDKSSILPALRLSYHYLPQHLKPCFSYCSIFPKDYEFKKEQLILLWMAEDFLQQHNKNKRPEEVGDEYFYDLTARSFFQRSSHDEASFVMHDLVNDLAQLVSGEFCFRLEGDDVHEIPEKTRHLSYIRTSYDVSKIFEAFSDAKYLRTFLPLNFPSSYHLLYLTKRVPHDLLPTRSYLRVLSLSHYNNISELPESIGNLKHLRYLDVSFTKIRRLPDSTSTLFNLQTLLLSKCSCLIELPVNMGRLINLRHLDVSGTILKEMPIHMSRLKCLQTMSTFIVGESNGSNITELRNFRQLRGVLHIMGLQKVGHARDALHANLKDKEYLDELVLEWGANTENSHVERGVLDKLQPHANLKKLTIKYYGRTRFPDWLVDHSLCNMVCLCLGNCKYCFSLPPLGQLPCLKDLSIIGFDGVESVGHEFYGNGSSANKPFGLLEILRFEEMLQWVEWLCSKEEGGEFPCLRELYVIKCPKLTKALPGHLPSLTKIVISECPLLEASLPVAPALREVKLIECNKVVLTSTDELNSQPSLHVPEISSVTSHFQPHHLMTTLPNPVGLQLVSCLHKLTIKSCDAVKSLPQELPPCLNRLEISDCPSLKSFPKGGLPITLKILCIEDCMELDILPPERTMHNYFASLQRFVLERSCDSLKSFPLGLFPKLNYLFIKECRNLQSFWVPEEGLHGVLISLDDLRIISCPKFEYFPKGGLPTPNLRNFHVSSCENLKSLPERMHTVLPFLQGMTVGCTALERILKGGLPSNLTSLSVRNCWMDWGIQRLACLVYFEIVRCEEVESFPVEWLLPSTLTSLQMARCPNLKYLDQRGLQHLTSLRWLRIHDCPKLQCFPEQELPISLSFLDIKGCPLLKERCRREKGEDWPKIAHIRCILIDKELIT